jgi:hypothetical protein
MLVKPLIINELRVFSLRVTPHFQHCLFIFE